MTGFVYAAADGTGRVKIGWSANPSRRLMKIRTDCSTAVQLLGLIPASRAQEKEAHTLLATWRENREWYRLDGVVRTFVEMLPSRFCLSAIEQSDSQLAACTRGMVSSFREIVQLWPSADAMAADVGASFAAARKWLYRGSIPAEWWAALLRTERAKANAITSELLLDLAARTQTTSPIVSDPERAAS